MPVVALRYNRHESKSRIEWPVRIQMRRLMMSRLIWIHTGCKGICFHCRAERVQLCYTWLCQGFPIPFIPSDQYRHLCKQCGSPSHRDLHCLTFCYWFFTKTLFAIMDASKFIDGVADFRNLGVKGFYRVIEEQIHCIPVNSGVSYKLLNVW